MADVKRKTLHAEPIEWINFARSMNCDLITIDDNDYICIGDVYRLKYDTVFDKLLVYENDSEMYQADICKENEEVDAIISCTSDFVWFTISNGGYSGHSACTCCFFYEILGGMLLYGWKFLSGNNRSISLSQFDYFTDKNTGFTYSHTPVLQLDAEYEEILISNEIITKDGFKIVTDPNFISCTTVDVGQVIVFDNHDYYSVSSHTLVPIWEESE